MRAIKKERLSEKILDAIKEIIEEENFEPGSKFYSENKLTQMLNVSRSSIREAIRILEVTGYVEVHQGKGIFIKERIEEDSTIKQWVVDNTDLLKEHFEVRVLIEPQAAKKAAEKSTSSSVEKLKQVYEKFCIDFEKGDISQAIRDDSKFHQLIAEMTGNRTLSILMKTMSQTLNEGWIASLNTPGRLLQTIPEHKEILNAIENKDSKLAEKAMKDHLCNALNSIKKFSKEF
ncbi:MAG: FadR/GntR family transcriptional regulator [Pleomorphochaeta sp.]